MSSLLMTVKDIKNKVYSGLPSHWITDWLLHVLDKPASFLISHDDYVLTLEEQNQFDAGIAKMQAGTPLAYLIGQQAFWSLEFEVNEYTLIPRPDTEVLVERVLDWIAENYQNNDINSLSKNHADSNAATKSDSKPISAKNIGFKLLDLGTGSGCIAISLAYELANNHLNKHCNQWFVTAIDYSEEALSVAKRNAQLNKVSNIEFIQSDWFGALDSNQGNSDNPSTGTQKFDVIVSNPPYIVSNDEHLPNLKAEPLSALVAEDNGLADIKHIINESAKYLVSGGLLAIEHGYDQGDLVREIFKNSEFSHVKTFQDYGGNDRVTIGVWNRE